MTEIWDWCYKVCFCHGFRLSPSPVLHKVVRRDFPWCFAIVPWTFGSLHYVLIGGNQSFREACCLSLQIRQHKSKMIIDPQADLPCYTGCNRRNGPDFGRVFLMLNYTEKPQNTYIRSWTVWQIMTSEVWNFDSCYTLTDYQIRIETGRNMWFL